MFNSCSKSMSACCLSKDNEKAYSVMGRIPTVQPKGIGKKKQLDKLDFPALQSIHTNQKIIHVLSICNKFYSDIHVYQTLQPASFP